MASLVRIRVSNLIGNSCAINALFSGRKEITLVRTITGKTQRCPDDISLKPKPYPYQEKPYSLWKYFFDKTTARLDENSKVVVVEGPFAVGKSKFAKELATELDMLYYPEANLDMKYINSYGYDLRKLDELLPPDCRSFDINNFLVNPRHKLTARFQLEQYIVKFSQYIDALAHLLSTGQGVVLDRCVFSDFVFVEAMYKHKYLSKAAYNYYYQTRNNTINELMRPHLVIYLDIPVQKVKDNIKKRAIPYEVNSPALTDEYLSDFERAYKQKYLKNISNHAELLVYDWSEEGDIEVVVEDIERIDFDKYDDQDPHMKDWSFVEEEEWAEARRYYADEKEEVMSYFTVPPFHVPELIVEAEDLKKYFEVLNEAPGEKYSVGYNSDMGDEGVFWKTHRPHRDTLPLRERRIPC